MSATRRDLHDANARLLATVAKLARKYSTHPPTLRGDHAADHDQAVVKGWLYGTAVAKVDAVTTELRTLLDAQ